MIRHSDLVCAVSWAHLCRYQVVNKMCPATPNVDGLCADTGATLSKILFVTATSPEAYSHLHNTFIFMRMATHESSWVNGTTEVGRCHPRFKFLLVAFHEDITRRSLEPVPAWLQSIVRLVWVDVAIIRDVEASCTIIDRFCVETFFREVTVDVEVEY